MKPSLPCSILRQSMMALSLLSCLSGVRRSLYHALRLQFPHVSCQSLLVVVWSCVPGWLHLCGPVLVLQLPHLLLPLPLLVLEYWSCIPVDNPSGLFPALGLTLCYGCLSVMTSSPAFLSLAMVLTFLLSSYWLKLASLFPA